MFVLSFMKIVQLMSFMTNWIRGKGAALFLLNPVDCYICFLPSPWHHSSVFQDFKVGTVLFQVLQLHFHEESQTAYCVLCGED